MADLFKSYFGRWIVPIGEKHVPSPHELALAKARAESALEATLSKRPKQIRPKCPDCSHSLGSDPLYCSTCWETVYHPNGR